MDSAKTAAGRSTRDQIVLATCDLLEAQGLHGTGLSAIIKMSGAPRGSLYYYFPDGKDGLAVAAIERTGAATAARISAVLASEPDVILALHGFISFIADAVEHSGFRAGGPLTAVAMETATTNERLNAACRDAYSRLEAAFADGLAAAGYNAERANQLATFITAAIEGGIILSRTYHSGDPLRNVARELSTLLQAAPLA